MIQMHYRESSLQQKRWEIYGEARIITKDMRRYARELSRNEFRFYEVRYVDTKKNPELAL